MRYRPQRYDYPHCKRDVARRKKRCCPGCGTLLLIVSDMLSHAELTELRSFWMRDPLKEKWDFIRDWEEHKVEAMRKFEECVFGRDGALGQEKKTYLPLPRGLQERGATGSSLSWRVAGLSVSSVAGCGGLRIQQGKEYVCRTRRRKE